MRRTCVTLLLFSLPILAGCARDASTGDPATTPTQGSESRGELVRILGSAWYGHAPAWVGMVTDTFADAGFDVEFQTVASSAERLHVLRSGEAELASVGEIAMLTQMANGNEAFYWVGNQNIAPGFEALVARADVKTWSDLRGKTIGLQKISSIEITVRLLLEAHGLDPDQDVTLLNAQATEIPESFRSGAVDAIAIWQPYLGRAMNAVPGSHALGWDTDTSIYQRYKTMTGPDVLVVARTWADADPARARRFLGAYFSAVATLAARPDEMARAVVEAEFLNEDAGEVAQAFKNIQWLGLERQREIMSDAGLFGQATEVAALLAGKMQTIPAAPDFRRWVKLDLLPEPPR